MSDADLRTVAHFSTAAEAVLARNLLLDAGIQAVVADEFMVTTDPLLSGAINYIKVQVRADELGRAAAVLDLSAPAVEDADAHDPTPREADEDIPLETKGEALVRYAIRAAVLGLLACPPLPHIYSLVQLVRVALFYRNLPPRANRAFYVAFVLDVLVIGGTLVAVHSVAGW
ncbi:MAG: DUF2007 domain-containing protein [Gemmataceae bacterium]